MFGPGDRIEVPADEDLFGPQPPLLSWIAIRVRP